MASKMPYQAKSRVSRLAGGSIGGTLNVGHGVVNVVMRLLVALFCFGLVLQTLNSEYLTLESRDTLLTTSV